MQLQQHVVFTCTKPDFYHWKNKKPTFREAEATPFRGWKLLRFSGQVVEGLSLVRGAFLNVLDFHFRVNSELFLKL